MKLKIKALGLNCPASLFTTDYATLNMLAGGCGPGKLGDWLVPDTLWGLSIRPACFIHDYMYSQGSTPQEKEIADQLFLSNMLRIIQKETTGAWFIGKALKAMRRNRAMLYYSAVVDNGGRFFDK